VYDFIAHGRDWKTFTETVEMQAPFDPELVTAGVYVVAVPLYLLLWRRHSRHCYAALAIAALILALCALLRSDAVRAWDPQPLRHQHQPAPTSGPDPRGDFSLIARRDVAGMAGSSLVRPGDDD
jgi:hypothetical protein